MSIVLGLLAALCGLSGFVALYFGYDLGGTERGVAYTVSGTIAVTAGAIMIGLSVLAVRLKQAVELLERAASVARPAVVEPALPPLSGSTLPQDRDQRPGVLDRDLPGAALPAAIGAAAVAAVTAAPADEDKVAQEEAKKEPGQAEPAPEIEDDKPPSAPDTVMAEPRPMPEIDLALDDLLTPEPPKEPIVPEQAVPAKPETEGEDHQEGDDRPLEKAALDDEDATPETSHPPLDEPVRPSLLAPDPLDDLAQELAAEPEPEPESAPEPAPLVKGRDRLEGIFGPPPDPTPSPVEEPAIAKQAELPPAKPQEAPSKTEAEIAPTHAEEAPPSEEKEPLVEDLPPWHSHAQFAPKPAASSPPAELVAEPEPPHAPEPPAPDETEHHAPATATPAATEEPGRKVVGSYTVGPNSYTMYGDGSVEALTPNGLFSFGSLEELRNFIEKGGSPASGR
jgi:hypothetical protein